jgi:hypothetical protein
VEINHKLGDVVCNTAVNMQRVARGRLARRGPQSTNVSAEGGAAAGLAKRTHSEGDLNTRSAVEEGAEKKQHEAAVGLQRLARGRQVRQEVAKQNEAAVSVQKITRGKLARKAAGAKKAGSQKAGDADAEPSGEGDGPAAESTGEPADGAAAEETEAVPQPAPDAQDQGHFGPGYAESLVNNS